MRTGIWFVQLLIYFALLLCHGQCAIAQTVTKGTADLREFDFTSSEPAYLSGSWGFYYNKLLTPEDFKSIQEPTWVDVPGSWHRSGNYPALGYGTYRVRLLLSPKQQGLMLYFRIINSAAKIWINGELMQESGKVGTDSESSVPKLSGTMVAIPEHVEDIDLVVQVSNFSYYNAGFGGTPVIDRSSDLITGRDRTNGIENFFAGSLIAMFFYQLILYLLFDRGKPYLWLSLICLGVAMRAMIVHGGSFLLPTMYPGVAWEIWEKIEFGSVYAMIAFFPLYVYHLFPSHSPRRPLILFVGVSGALFLMVLATRQYTYGALLEVCHVALLLTFVYAFYSITRAWRDGNKDARIILFGVLASFPFILLEILKNSALYPIDINFTYLVELGVLVFLLFQVYLLANHFAHSYKKLEALNESLERIVTERTAQLTTANTVKDRLLSVMSHDIKSPLNSLRGILQVYSSGAITREEFGELAQRVENDLSKTNLLVENILFWTTSQLKGVKVRIEKFNLQKLIEENLELFHTLAANKKIVFQHNTPTGLMITSDRNILNFVIRNLIANAVKFSHEGGEISILVSVDNRLLSIQIKDHGVGMDEETLAQLMRPESTISTHGTSNEKGAGLGLTLCREYLIKAGGQLTVESKLGEGSTFSFLLPVK